MSKHTPGPWLTAGEDKAFVYALSPNGINSFWAHVQTAGQDRISDTEKNANARLIAAAPELYDAAEAALNALLACCVPAGGVDDRKAIVEAQWMLRAAIRKATGEA